MNKELTPLEALERIINGYKCGLPINTKDIRTIETTLKRLELLESNQIFIERAKKLKALEIIKDKISWNFAIKYWWENHEINDEEYDLLKEVFL